MVFIADRSSGYLVCLSDRFVDKWMRAGWVALRSVVNNPVILGRWMNLSGATYWIGE